MLRRVIWVVFCLFLAATFGLAQQDQGVITGTVTDSTGAVIPGAQVTARETQTNITTETQTNESGVYVLGPLKVGTYEISVESAGFKKAVRSGVEIHPNDRIGMDFQLELGNLTEVIEVTGETPLLKTETSSLEQVVDRRQIDQLPLVDRNYQILAKLAPGVLPEIGGRDRGPLQRGGQLASGFTSHGQPALQNNYLIDGIDNNSTVMGMQDRKAQAVIPSLDAVQEFKVQTSNYSAEFGRNAGAVVNVTIKSGTNEIHGSAYNYVRNDAFDARPTFGYTDRDGDGKADPAVLRQNMFGATLGGPFIRNKTFGFFSWESWRVRNSQTDRSVVPTDLEKAGDFSQTAGLTSLKDPLGGTFPGMKIPASRQDPVAVALMELYPEPNYSDVTRTNYLSNPPWKTDRNQYDLRVDHNFSSKDTMFGRYSWYDFDALRGAPLPGLARGASGNDRSLDANKGRSLALSETHVFSTTVVNEFRFGYKYLKVHKRNDSDIPMEEANARYGIKGVPPPKAGEVYGLSRITLGGKLGFIGLGGANFQPNIKDTSTYQFLDNLTWIHGNHSMKFGADIRYDQSMINGIWQGRGQRNFNGRFTGISLGDMLLGWANTAQLSTPVLGYMRFRSWMFYAQDDWKITPNFTLNIGLRYELTTPWFEKNNHMSTMDVDPSSSTFGHITYPDPDATGYADRALLLFDKNNWAPRIGFAWRLGDKWTIRSGAGIFYGGQMALGASARPMQNYPFASSVTKRATKKAPAQILADGFPADFLGDLSLVYEADDLPPNSNYRVWDYDYQIPQTEQWNFSVQRELTSSMALTLAYVGSATQNISYQYDINSAGIGDPNTEKQRRRIPNLSAINFRTPLAHSSFHGLDASLEKRFSHGVAFTLAYTWGHNIGQAPDQFVGGDNGAPQDIHCFSCEKGNSSSDVRHRVVSSYIVDLPFGRGKPLLDRGGVLNHIIGGWQLSGWVSVQTGMYFSPQLSNAAAELGTGGVGIWRPDLVGDWKLDNPTPDGWFNPAAFARPCDPDGSNCRFGNLGRNNLQEPGMFDWTAALAKKFSLTERFKLDFRWEIMNILNHPNYGTPNRSLDSPDVGIIRGTNNLPRSMQFGLRLSF